MKKKLLSVLLMFVMALSLAACGTKKAGSGNSSKTVFDSMKAQEANSVSMVFEMSMDDENLAFKMDVTDFDDKTAAATLDMKMNLEGMNTGASYVRLTDVLVEEDIIYVNVASVLDFMAELDPQYAMLAEYFELPGDYLKLTLDDLTELYSDMLGMDIDFAELMEASLEETTAEDKASTDALLEVMCKFIDDFASREGSQLTISDGKISISVTEKNFTEFMEALAQVDVEEYLMQYAEAMDKIEGGVDYTAAMKQEIEGLNDQIKKLAEELKEDGIDEDEQVAIDFTMGTEGKNNVVSASINVKDEYEDVTMALSLTTSPDKGTAVATPDSVMTYDEFMSLMGY